MLLGVPPDRLIYTMALNTCFDLGVHEQPAAMLSMILAIVFLPHDRAARCN